MGYLDLTKYIYGPADLFELQGRTYTNEPGVPCRVKVGPRRFLDIKVKPEELKLTLWMQKDGQVTYLQDQQVPVVQKEDGSLEVDAVALTKQYFGKSYCLCDKDAWRWNKNRTWSNLFLATPYGAATSNTVWLDIDWIHSGLRFAPGALTLCGHEVRGIYWSTFSDTCSAHGEDVRPLVEKVLSGPHSVEAEDVEKCLAGVKELWFNRLCIDTDRGRYRLDTSLDERIVVNLADGSEVSGYKISRKCKCLDQVNVLLRLMKAQTREQVIETLEELKQEGLVKGKAKK